MSNNYVACLSSVANHGKPPVAFLDELVSVIKALPDEVFAPNDNVDIYSLMAPILGPWRGMPHRRAAMAEVLRVDAAFESSWNWNEGADSTAGPENPDEMEAGAWQVSANSMNFDQSLKECVQSAAKSINPFVFQAAMKDNHALAVEYAARLFRFNTRWSGPANRGWIQKAVSREAVAEFETFLS